MVADVQVAFHVSCSSDGSPGFDHRGVRWWVLSVQWPDMPEPEYLWIPLKGKKNEDGTPHNPDRDPGGEGDDTHDVAAEAAAAFNRAFAMGDIPLWHQADVDIELDHLPPIPGQTNGRVLLRGLRKVDIGATEAKLQLKVFSKLSRGQLRIRIDPLPKPRQTHDRGGGRTWATWRLPKDGRFPPWPPETPHWERIPLRTRYRQFLRKRIRPTGLLLLGSPSDLPPPWEQRPLPQETPWSCVRRSTFAIVATSARDQARELACALQRAGLGVETRGSAISSTPRDLADELVSCFEIWLGTDESRSGGELPFPWHLTIGFSDRPVPRPQPRFLPASYDLPRDAIVGAQATAWERLSGESALVSEALTVGPGQNVADDTMGWRRIQAGMVAHAVHGLIAPAWRAIPIVSPRSREGGMPRDTRVAPTNSLTASRSDTARLYGADSSGTFEIGPLKWATSARG